MSISTHRNLSKKIFPPGEDSRGGRRYISSMKQESSLRTIEVSMQEIWQHTRPVVHRNKKAYTRKAKHRKSPGN